MHAHLQIIQFSHQNPSFIGAVLNLKAKYARVYLPPDVNCMISTIAHCLNAKNYINLVVGSKLPTPVWLTAEEAAKVASRLRDVFTADMMPSSTAKLVPPPGNLLAPMRAETPTAFLLESEQK
jgi:hypothetical protein